LPVVKKRRKPDSLGITTVRIGKKGVTTALIQEILKNLKKKRTVKVAILKTGLGDLTTKEIAERVAEETRSRILQIRGHTFTLRKLKGS